MRPSPALAGLLLLVCAPATAQHKGHRTPQAQPTAQLHSSHAMTAVSPAALPAPTPAERAAAFPDLHGMEMRDHMNDDPFVAMLQVDELESRDNDDADGFGWDVRGWAGYSFNRAWLRSEGERIDSRTENAKLELLWGHAMNPWWDFVAGVRHDVGEGASRDWLAIGLQGLAPYKFEVEATAYVGQSGRLAATLEAEYDVLLTNRLILQPKAEITAHARDDADNGFGKGLSDVEFGLRLRYEWHRQFAPYVGYAWSRRFGRTADFAAGAGEHALQRGWVAGIRFWF